jgi:hypothetical protein
MAVENLLHDLTLHADTPAVDDAHLRETSLQRLTKVFLDHALDFPRLEGVEIDPILDRHFDRLVCQFPLLLSGFSG